MSEVDLCTAAEVRALMQKTPKQTSQDALIERLVTQASEAIMRHCDREFAPAVEGVTRTFEFPWEQELVSLAPYDLRSLTEVRVDTDVGDKAGIVLSTDEWRLWPQPPRDGTYLSLRVRPFSARLGRIMWHNRQIQITGDWGFAAVPDDVALAAAQTVVHWMTVNTAWFRRPDDDPNIMHFPRRGIPPEAYETLNRYKRSVTA